MGMVAARGGGAEQRQGGGHQGLASVGGTRAGDTAVPLGDPALEQHPAGNNLLEATYMGCH